MERIPLYNKDKKIFMIHKDNLYERILYDHYRIVDENFYKNSNQKIPELENFNWSILPDIYYKLFYNSFIKTNHITECRRPSYDGMFKHIKPYYTLDELNYLAKDWNILKTNDMTNIQLCNLIQKHDIPSKTLFQHEEYIYKNKSVGLVKYYSLFGSDILNKYLRNVYSVKNEITENSIILMSNLISNIKIKDLTVYRFINNDYYINHLKIGDTYSELSFISTTRNPFYYQHNYDFGYILLKIKLDNSSALCIESYSNFPDEQEIILPPTTILRLDNIIENDDKTHDNILKKNIIKKYEFTVIGHNIKNIKFPETSIPKIKILDLETMLNFNSNNIKSFFKNILNDNYQFTYNNKIFNVESYDSSNVYKPFFYYTTSNGMLIYSVDKNKGNINLMLEVGKKIHVNYYFKYSISDVDTELDINFISSLAYYLGIQYVVIHPNYFQSKNIEKGYNAVYPENIYEYLKNNKKLYENVPEINEDFEYFHLDNLEKIKVDKIINDKDRDELFQFYIDSKCKNLKEFYLYLIDKHNYLLDLLTEKLNKHYNTTNPFINSTYTLDTWTYLYNNKKIIDMPTNERILNDENCITLNIYEHKVPKFTNRLRYYLNNN